MEDNDKNNAKPSVARPIGPDAGDILASLAGLYRERNAVYKDNYKHIGGMMAALFPDGITLRTPNDHVRFHLFVLAMVKVTRYTNNWKTGHSDSAKDAAVYMAMLDAVDLGAVKNDYGKITSSEANNDMLICLARMASDKNANMSGDARRSARNTLFKVFSIRPESFLTPERYEEWLLDIIGLDTQYFIKQNKNDRT